MIVEYLRYRVGPDRQAAFIAAYAAASVPLLASPYALGYELSRCVEDPGAFILRIEWTSREDHLDGFRGSEQFRSFFAHVRPFVGDIEEMRHYSLVPPEG